MVKKIILTIGAFLLLTGVGCQSNPSVVINKNLLQYNNKGELKVVFDVSEIKSYKISNLSADFPINEVSKISKALISTDGKYIYFLTNAWTTSDALFSYDIETESISYISDSNYLGIVKGGKYKDMLITNKHKYYNGGGSYDNFFITNPNNSQDIKDLGKNLDVNVDNLP